MLDWLTPPVAVGLMLLGVAPSLLNVYLLYGDRHKPGVLWFLASMATGGVWAFLSAMITLIPSPTVTLALANVFWAVVPTAALTMFLLAYEFVFKRTVSRRTAGLLFAPIVLLFLLTWINPWNLVFTAEYYVDANGFLHFPLFGGILRVGIAQVYGYGLAVLAAGMFVGETMRTTGVHRRQAAYLLVIFSALVVSTMVKVVGLVPVYYDPTSTVYAFSGLLFAYSINKRGLLKFVPIAREQTFEEATDAILVVDPDDVVVDVNQSGRNLFEGEVVGKPIDQVLPDHSAVSDAEAPQSLELTIEQTQRHFSVRTSPINYGRDTAGKIFILSDISALKEREQELNLLKEILSRVFRHNIRNDLTVINGYAELIEEQSDGQIAEWAAGIRNKSDHLVNQAEKVRRIEGVISVDQTAPTSLRQTVQRAISSYQAPGHATVHTAVEDVTVECHPKLYLAVRELIENAIEHHGRDGDPQIEIYSESNEDCVDLVIEDNGPGIPQTEIDVLHAGEETSLQHGSGIGLWLVRWIVSHSNGELLAETTDRGSRITIRLQRVPA